MNLQMLKKAMLAYVSAVKFIWSEIAYPLSIVGKKLMNLRGYRVYGNSVQDGTPAPDNPVEIESVGDLSTKNLFSFAEDYTNTVFGLTFSFTKGESEFTVNGDMTQSIGYRFAGTAKLTMGIGVYTFSTNIVQDYSQSGLFVYNLTTGDRLGFFNSDNKLTLRFTEETDISIGFSLAKTNYNNKAISIQLEEGTTATDYEPYHKYKISVVARGRNLIPIPTFGTFTQNGVTFTNNKDGTITINGTPTAFTSTPNMYLPDSTLEILRNNVCVLTGFYYYEKNISFALSIGLNGNWIKYIYLNPYTYKNYVKVDLTNVEFDTVVLTVRSQNVGVLIDNLTVKPLLEVGTTMPTSFEPYIAPVTTNIFLDEPLRKVGDYADYIDFEKQKVVRNVEVLDDTGTKTIDESLGVNNPPTEETVKLPALPQFKGTTIYEVGTNIKPSGMEAKYC